MKMMLHNHVCRALFIGVEKYCKITVESEITQVKTDIYQNKEKLSICRLFTLQ